MAKCQNCEQAVTEKATVCPNCGADLQPAASGGVRIASQVEVSTTVAGARVTGVEIGQVSGPVTVGYSAGEVQDLIADLRSTFEPKPYTGECPYVGLQTFQEEDAGLFFGRERLVGELLERVSAIARWSEAGGTSSLVGSSRPAASARFILIAGPSGSGKSSLLRAGLLPALKGTHPYIPSPIASSKGWLYGILRPGRSPLEALGREVARLTGSLSAVEDVQHKGLTDRTILSQWLEIALGDQPERRAFLLVDQFEEIFTQLSTQDETVRASFLNLLVEAATAPHARTIVILTMRSDFVDNCADYPALNDLLNQGFFQVGGMSGDELVSAIVRPALEVGLQVDPALVSQVIADMQGEPGALPLMQFSLKDLFESLQAQGGVVSLTLDGYLRRGGLQKALERYADKAFSMLSNREQELARSVFSGLVQPSQGRQDTARTALFSELTPQGVAPVEIEALIRKLADARLLTTEERGDAPGDDRTARLAHERLLESWPWLHRLVAENREAILLANQVNEDAQAWQKAAGDASYLYSGARLAQAREWASANAGKFNAAERDFLQAAIEQEEHQARQDEAQRQRELVAAHALAETQRQTARQLRRRAIVLFAVLLLAIAAALAAGILANRNSTLARQNAAIAQTAQAVSQQALTDFTRSEAQRLAADARSLMQSASDPQLIALLSLRSINTEYTTEGDAVLTAAAAQPLPRRIFSGHGERVYSVSFSPDDKYILTGSYDGIVRLFDAQTGQEIRQFTANEEGRGVKAIFSPDGQTIYAASNDNTAWKWDRETGQVLFQLSGEEAPIDIEVSPDGQRLLVGSATGTPMLLDAQTGDLLCQFTGHSRPVWELAFSPDGRYVATASVDKTARLWQAEDCAFVRTFAGHADGVASVDFSPDGKYLATGSWDKTARLWEVESGQELRQFIGHTCYLVRSVSFSPDGRHLLTGNCDKTAKLWDIQTGRALASFNGQADQIWSVAFSHDGRHILTGSYDQTAWLWDLQEVYGEHPQIGDHTDSIWSVAISPDGNYVATGGAVQGTRLWDARTGQELHTFTARDVNSLAFSPDGRSLLAGASDGSAWLWEVQTKDVLQRFQHYNSSEGVVMGVAFSPDGKYALTSGQDAYAKRWDMLTGELLTTYGAGTSNPGGTDSLYGVAYSPDGKTVLTGGWDGVMRLYDEQSGNELRQFTADDIGSIYGVAFSPDGRQVIGGSKDMTAHIWDLETGEEVQRLVGHTAYLYAVAFSPDGKLALTSSADNTARLWDLQTGKELRRFIGHTGPVEWAAFSANGKTFVTGSDDGTARIWSVNLQTTMDYLCANLLRDLSAAEREQYHINDNLPTCPVQ